MVPNELDEVDLATWIDGLRRELLRAEQAMVSKAQEEGAAPGLLFSLSELRIDVEVRTEQKTRGGAEVGPNLLGFKVLTGKVDHERTKGQTQRVSLVLKPLGGGATLGSGEPGGFQSPGAPEEGHRARTKAATKKALRKSQKR